MTKNGLVVDGGNASFRIDQDGFPTAVVTARFIQRNTAAEADLPAHLVGVRLYGGVTIITDPDGRVRHLLGRPVPGSGDAGNELLKQMLNPEHGQTPVTLDCLPRPA